MTRPKDDSSHIFPSDDELPSWAESTPDWRTLPIDELNHERFIYERTYQD